MLLFLFCFCREIRSNEVLNWTSDKSIVTFMPNRTYIFDPDTSCTGCDDKNDSFVTVNIPLLVRRQEKIHMHDYPLVALVEILHLQDLSVSCKDPTKGNKWQISQS